MNDRLGAGFQALRKQARRWLASLRAGDPEAFVRLAQVLPRHTTNPGLREVQQALAREHGFGSWAQLKEHHQLLGLTPAGLLDELLQSACIFSGGPLDVPAKWRRAERIRVLHPELATASLHTAVVCGELGHVETLLRRDPSLATKPGGPQGWEPLLLLCYGRLPNARFAEHSVAIAERLLEAGAHADTTFVHPGGELRFSALTGVMGHGEMGQPEHPRAEELARLLLARGANPNDSQGLYNTHLGDDDPKWLALLLAHGLGPRDPANWDTDPAALAKAEPILSYLVAQAAANGHLRRLTLLLEHGADPDARSRYNGKSCWRAAMTRGRTDLAELLAKHGAQTEPLTGFDAFLSACNLGDRERAAALLDGHPEYLWHSDPLVDAASNGRREAVSLLVALGMDPNRPGRHGHLALHDACRDRAMAELLLSLGADPRRWVYGATAAGWGRRAGTFNMARFFAERTRDLLDAVLAGHVELARDLIAEDPSRVHARAPDGATALFLLPEDPELAGPLLELLLAHGVEVAAVDREGKTAAAHLEALGLDELADRLP